MNQKRIYPSPEQLGENEEAVTRLKTAEQALKNAGIAVPEELLSKIEEASKQTKSGLPEWARNPNWIPELEKSKVAIENAIAALEGNGAIQAVISLKEELRLINQILAEPVERLHNLSRAEYARKVSRVVMSQTETTKELSPELQAGLGQLHENFDSMPDLHPDIEWVDVERSLRVNPKALGELIEVNNKGHAINVFGREGNAYIFATAQLDVTKMDASHRNIMFDKAAQDRYPNEKCNGNAVDIGVKMGMELADEILHEQLRRLYGPQMNGAFYLKTDKQTRESGIARFGGSNGVRDSNAGNLSNILAARFSRRVDVA